MVAVVCALAVLGQSLPPSQIDGEGAVAIARQFLRREGVREPLEITYLDQQDGKAWGFATDKCWAIGFVGSKGLRLSVYLSPDGEVQHMQSNHFVHPPTPKVRPDPSDKRLQGIAVRLLKPAGARESVSLQPIEVMSDQTVVASFALMVNGHRFFNLNPTYAYRLTFFPDTGELVDFTRPKAAPPVNASAARVDGKRAAEDLEKYVRAHPEKGAGVFAPGWPGKAWITAELGYFKFIRDREARLVWRGLIWDYMSPGPKRYVGPMWVFIDALDGTLLLSEDAGTR